MKIHLLFILILASSKISAQSLYGVDIYSGNGTNVNWSTVYGAGKSFAYVKASKGVCYTDGQFNNNMTSLNSNGVILGAYHFALPEDNTAIAEANYFVSIASSYIGNGYLPPALDLEDPLGSCIVNTQALSSYFTASTLANWVQTWCSQVHSQTGVWPVLYVNRCLAGFLYPYYQSGAININIKLWIADYTNSAGNPNNYAGCSPWVGWPWVFHQYFAPATAGNNPSTYANPGMDQDIFNGTITDFNNLIGTSTSSCTDNFESNNSCSSATAVFGSSLGIGTANYTPLGTNIGYAGDQDWFKVQLTSCGTLTLNLSTLPYDYDLELYGAGCLSQFISGSYNGTTNNEQIIYTSTTSTPTDLYIKVYPYSSSTYTTANCYTLNFAWTGTACSSCTWTVSPTLASYSSSGVTNDNFIVSGTCAGNVQPSTSWINGLSVSGNTIYYNVDPNNTCSSRTGYIYYQDASFVTQATYTITQAGLSTPNAVTVTGGGTTCSGSLTLNASGGGGGTIYWQGTTSGGTSTATSSTSQTVTSSGTYYFRSYNSCGWGTEGSATVTINTIPTSVTVSGGGTSCSSATLTASGGSGGTNYWQGTTSGGTSTATPSTSQTVTSSGTYYFRAYNSCGWGAEGSATVTINTVPSSVTVSIGGTSCTGATLTASGGSGGTIYWQGATSGGTSTATPSTSQTVTSSGTYYFRAYNSCGWGTEGSATVTIGTIPTSVTVSGGGIFCTSTTLTASGGTGGTIYWQGTTSGGTSTATTTNPFTVTSSGTYYFRAYNSCGWSTEGSAIVTINTIPSSVTVTTSGTSCTSTTLTATGGSGGTIYWQGTTSGGTSTATPSTSQTITSSGTYYFRAYNSCGWGVQGSVTVTIGSPPSAVTVTGGGTFCNNATLTASGGSGGTIYWQGTTSGGTSTATTTNPFTVTSSGTYYFRAYNSCGWSTEGSATVTINPPPFINITSNPINGIACGTTTQVTLTANGANTYSWSGGISNGIPFTATSSTTYTVTATDINGCTNTSTQSVTIGNIPTVTSTSIPINGIVCNGGSATLSGSGANTYSWSGGISDGISFTPTSTTTYTVTGTNSAGCTNTATKTIAVSPSPIADFFASTTTGNCPFLVDFFDNSTAGAISWSWTIYNGSGAPLTPTFQNPTGILYNVAGSYLVKLKITNACGDSSIKIMPNYINVSCPNGIEETTKDAGLFIYPNPTDGKFLVNSLTQINSIEIYNMLGEKIIQITPKNLNTQINLSSYSKGVYFLIATINGINYTKKIIKQ